MHGYLLSRFLGLATFKIHRHLPLHCLCKSKIPQRLQSSASTIIHLLADTILVWTPYALAGVYVFCFAQFMHLTRLTKLPQISLCIYAGGLSLFFALCIANGMNPIYAVATVYGLQLICNLVMSVKNWRANSKHFRTRCAFYGFVAFLCCDICVALRFMALDGALPAELFLPYHSCLGLLLSKPSTNRQL